MSNIISSRQAFGDWGLGLEGESFAAALAELGVASRPPGDVKEHARLDRVLLQHSLDLETLKRSPLTLSWNGGLQWVAPEDRGLSGEASDWAAAWRALARELADAHGASDVAGAPRVRLEVTPLAPRIEPLWLTRTLLEAPRVSSVTFRAEEPEAPRPWDWPIDIAFLDDEASRRLRHDVEPQYWKNFVRFCNAAHAASQIDILLLPFNVPDAIAALARSRHPAEVHTVLALGGSPGTRDPLTLLEALRREAGAVVAGACDVHLLKRNTWLDTVVFALSHDRTLDEALFDSRKSAGSAELPLLLGTPGALANARASVAAVRVCRRAEPRLSEERDPVTVAKMAPPVIARHLGIEPADSPRTLAERLGNSPEALPWQHEGEAASAVAGVAEAARKGPDPTRDNRYVQGRVFARREVGESRISAGPLAPDTAHRLEIRIAAPDADWEQAPTPVPTHLLPPDTEGHQLTVVLVDPCLLPEPLVDTLWLPASGNSKSCSFHFSTIGKAKRLDARVTILYQNRILQTLRFRAPIAGRTGTQEEARGLRIDLEAVLRQELHGLSGSPKYDAALLLNEDANGTPGLTAFQDEKVAYISLQSLEPMKRRIRAELEKITANPKAYGKPNSKATRELLVTLARLGRGFYEGFAELPGIGALLPIPTDGMERRPRRLQLLSMHPDDLLSLEFCYDQETPDEDAKACPAWRKVLDARPSEAGCCPRPCPQDLLKTVCPLGFWGLVDTIERHMYDPEKAANIQRHGAEFEVRCEAVDGRRALPPLRRVLLGVADKAKDFDLKGFQAAIDGMRASICKCGGQLVEVGSWRDWGTAIKVPEPPGLLMLIAHTEEISGATTLQIGSDNTPSTRIKAPQVHLPPIVPPEAGPLVLLFGCRTATEEVPFSSFVRAFRTAGASVVVATLSTVRGRHMAPAAKEMLAVLLEQAGSEPESIGDVLVSVRRKLLARGMPVGLTFVAYGDASWQLGRTI